MDSFDIQILIERLDVTFIVRKLRRSVIIQILIFYLQNEFPLNQCGTKLPC